MRYFEPLIEFFGNVDCSLMEPCPDLFFLIGERDADRKVLGTCAESSEARKFGGIGPTTSPKRFLLCCTNCTGSCRKRLV